MQLAGVALALTGLYLMFDFPAVMVASGVLGVAVVETRSRT